MVQVIGVPALSEVASLIGADHNVTVGWFASRLGAGAAMASLVAHLGYGLTLGVVYGHRRDR
jgi:hypothetical protein